jgi:hypothetical protein
VADEGTAAAAERAGCQGGNILAAWTRLAMVCTVIGMHSCQPVRWLWLQQVCKQSTWVQSHRSGAKLGILGSGVYTGCSVRAPALSALSGAFGIGRVHMCCVLGVW